MTERLSITSGTQLPDVEHHFRVFAGPGAGKTYWLIRHITNVLARSSRLRASAQIASISYTNVAAGKILQGLGVSAARVDVSTIHSFFYRNIVAPYLHFMRTDDGDALVDYAQVDGHDEHRPGFSAVKDWLEMSGKTRLCSIFASNSSEWFTYLKSLAWRRDESTGQWSMNPVGGWKPIPEYLPIKQLGSYKSVYWRRGIVDHDDVLYFAHRILEENQGLLPFLAARFPYLFVDEFQDTNPVQTQVTKWLAAAGTVVGVIGDVEQAIFGFHGSRYEDFEAFALPGQIDYEIPGNRRSTDTIVAFLNYARGDNLIQEGMRKIVGQPVRVLVGSYRECYETARELVGDNHPITILSRSNDTVSELRRASGAERPDPWPAFEKADADRQRLFYEIVAAGELAIHGQYELAMRTLLRGCGTRKGQFRKPIKCDTEGTDLRRRALAVSVLEFLVTHHDELVEETLAVAYGQIGAVMSRTLSGLTLTGVRPGGFKSFAESVTYRDLAASVRLVEETRPIRTIHKAKGDEFERVLVVLADEAELERVLWPKDVPSKLREEKRITYVGMSRAKDHLMLSVPEVSARNIGRLVDIGVEVMNCSRKGGRVSGV